MRNPSGNVGLENRKEPFTPNQRETGFHHPDIMSWNPYQELDSLT